MTKLTNIKSTSPLDREPPYSREELVELSRLAREDAVGNAIGPDGKWLIEPNADGEIVVESHALEALQRLQQHDEWVAQHRDDERNDRDKAP